ncbi:MAG: hypothetical protein J5I41_03790 [Saprospiraceae bacterium]|nr:hypothetical protein [Saprospiraceae bacterium]
MMHEKGPSPDDWRDFLQYFPEVSLPVSLTASSAMAFARDNPPLPALWSAFTVERWEEGETDAYTEFQPGFSFRIGRNTGIVYWKASLLHYAYILVILSAKGEVLDRLELAETRSEEGLLFQGAAVIEEDGSICMVESSRDPDEPEGGVTPAVSERWLITAEGRIQEWNEAP